jgi:hypothetical protein
MAKTRPSFQFYPSDWREDIALSTCSFAAKGFWIDLICLMHLGNPYGTLTFSNGSAMTDKDVMKALSTHPKTFQGLFKELSSKGVIKRQENGIYYCARMVKDEHIRQVRGNAGAKGYEAYLLGQNLGQKDPPSSSSSSSFKKEIFKEKNDVLLEKFQKPEKQTLPDGWQPSPFTVETIKRSWPNVDVSESLASFANYQQGKGVEIGHKGDWEKVFIFWCRNANRFKAEKTVATAAKQHIVPAEQRKGGVVEL